jgi:hypothetical protein
MSALTWKRKSRLVLGSQPSTNSGSKGNLEAFLMERLLRQSRLCEDVNSLAAPVAKESLMERVRSCLFCSTRSKTTIRKISTMKLTTIGLALALALASKIALAEGTLNYSLPSLEASRARALGDQASEHLLQEFARPSCVDQR